ncbi:MAG TPA: hypothetical protein VF787_17000 [Thermoanaerobaculia bacterium]
MNQHLTQEELILSYYGEPALGSRGEHLDTCGECRAELGKLAAVLDRVTPLDVPEPADDYESRVWDRLNWRLRGEKKRERNAWLKWAAVAAIVAIAFAGGLLWNRRTDPTPSQHIATSTNTTDPSPTTSTATTVSTKSIPSHDATQTATPTASAPRDRILLVVVGDHFDQSERMLVELTNITPSDDDDFDITTERAKAEELLASNRLYRRTAADRGEGNVATLLDELEPMLMQIAHAPEDMTAEELRTMQKRVETKGLVFKLRVVRADVTKKTTPRPAEPTT